jgi:chorismate synthase
MKPISTTLKPLSSINLAENKSGPTVYERSDFCAVQRACVVGEAVLSLVILNALVDKIGGDERESMLKAFDSMHKGRLFELTMKKSPWRFNYER